MSRSRTATALALAFASLAIPTAAQADTFSTPTGNIVCRGTTSRLACDVRNLDRTVVLGRYDLAFSFFTQQPLYTQSVLPYGYRWYGRSFTCRSQTAGMTCHSRYTGRGFFANRNGIRIF